jgi:hypothetical protein
MSRLLRLAFVCAVLTSSLLSQTYEYKRPSIDASWSGCGSIVSASMAAVYSSKSGSGPNTTASSSISVSGGSSPSGESKGRIFYGWSGASGAYTALTINTNQSCGISISPGSGFGEGSCEIDYSLDSGATWNTMYSYDTTSTATDPQATVTLTIPYSVVLTKLQVLVCVIGTGSDVHSGTVPATADLTVWDIWSTGTVASGGSSFQGHPVIISQ